MIPGMAGSGSASSEGDAAAGDILYAVYSRRSGGLSLGVNLFPLGKSCSFDCPYCEVFPFPPGEEFSVPALEEAFASFFSTRRDAEFPGTPVKDLCLSGAGEPSLSPHLESALNAMAAARRRYCPEADLVLITNATGFLSTPVFDVVERFARKAGISVWAKLDAGTEEWFRVMSGDAGRSLAQIVAGIERYALLHPVILQTMVCSVRGRVPCVEEMDAYAARVEGLLAAGADVAGIQLYTQARPAPLGITAPVSERVLVDMALRVREATQGRVPVRTYGAR